MKQIVGGVIGDFLITKCNMFVNLYEDALNLDALYHCYLRLTSLDLIVWGLQ